MTSPASARSGLDPSLASLTGSAVLPGAVRTQVPGKRPGVPSHRDLILLALLLGGTAIVYLWGLDQSGWANQFYAAAGQAGSQSWKAFLFGSLDASNFITVDKSPASLWVIDLSMRLFGVNSWSLLIPQALEGVAAVVAAAAVDVGVVAVQEVDIDALAGGRVGK